MPMSEEDRLLVHAYVDGELDFTDALALEKRIAGDQALMAERDRVMALQTVLRTRIEPERPSPALRGRIETAVGLRHEPAWRWPPRQSPRLCLEAPRRSWWLAREVKTV